GVQHIKHSAPGYQITARTVIHKLNYRIWPSIIECAGDMGLDQISFLPADVSSHAFNREVLWSPAKQHELLLDRDELPDLKNIIESIISRFGDEIRRGFVSESPEKLMKVHQYYAAFYGLSQFPYKKCNAPWVSTVIEADGTVRPCFFHARIGNIHDESLEDVLNGERGMQFRESLDIQTDSTCKKCVCYLNLPAGASVSSNENLNR
ncbi:MAG TPA: SPASM domain-containing protein, partial [Puia sp.]|nr:SPASM domain-containing protein [Puia sp.]